MLCHWRLCSNARNIMLGLLQERRRERRCLPGSRNCVSLASALPRHALAQICLFHDWCALLTALHACPCAREAVQSCEDVLSPMQRRRAVADCDSLAAAAVPHLSFPRAQKEYARICQLEFGRAICSGSALPFVSLCIAVRMQGSFFMMCTLRKPKQPMS